MVAYRLGREGVSGREIEQKSKKYIERQKLMDVNYSVVIAEGK